MSDRSGEVSYLANYDASKYPFVAVTVDIALFTIRDRRLHVLLVERGAHPYKRFWALPGGFVKENEDLDAAAERELVEETNLTCETVSGVHLEQLSTYGAAGRDPRMRVFSVAYIAFAPNLPDPTAGSDASEAKFVPVENLGLPDLTTGKDSLQLPGTSMQLAFDHTQILVDALDRCRAKLEYTPLATAFTREEFTISELRNVYEAVWGETLHAGNFHRKVLSVPGFVESLGVLTDKGGEKGGPKAKLYKRGDARLLHPALLRPSKEEEVR